MKKLLICTLLISTQVFALTGREVMNKIQAKSQGYLGATSKMVMTLIDAHGAKVERIMNAEVLENTKTGDKSITAFEKPLDVKGTKLLTWTVKDGANSQWLFLPKFKRVKKINSRNQAGSFMGSEFSYEDIAGQQIDKYKYKLLKEDAKSWTVESTPIDKSGYSKMITVISKDKVNPLSIEYFDRKGELLKVSTLENFKTYKANKKSFELANKITMENKQTKKKSVIEWTKRILGVKLKESDFKSTKLK